MKEFILHTCKVGCHGPTLVVATVRSSPLLLLARVHKWRMVPGMYEGRRGETTRRERILMRMMQARTFWIQLDQIPASWSSNMRMDGSIGRRGRVGSPTTRMTAETMMTTRATIAQEAVPSSSSAGSA